MEGRDVGELNESSKVSLMVKKSCVGLKSKVTVMASGFRRALD